jgi:anti-sigma factor RsiW
MSAAEEITCRELVELVTEYLEGALSPAHRARFEEHVTACEGCSTYVDQVRATVAASGRLTEDDLDPQIRERLLEAFRGWRD